MARKKLQSKPENQPLAAEAPTAVVHEPVRRKRGRPRKVLPLPLPLPLAAEAPLATGAQMPIVPVSPEPAKRKRGRPSRLLDAFAAVVEANGHQIVPEAPPFPITTEAPEPTRKKRGRPLRAPVVLAAPTVPAPAAQPRGLKFDRVFSTPTHFLGGLDDWGPRLAEIKDHVGNVVFSQEVKAPKVWSDQAVRVVASKYLYGDAAKGNDPTTGGRESSVAMLISRVADTIAGWGREGGYFASANDAETFRQELSWLLVNQHGSFNSPVWFNMGLSQAYGIQGSANGFRWEKGGKDVVPSVMKTRLASGQVVSETAWVTSVKTHGRVVPVEDAYKHPQASACFLQSVTDDMKSIGDLAVSEMMLFKFGSGTGTDLSPLRSKKEKLAGGGTPSGPVSFMEIYDAIAGVVKSGGKTRRAAKLQLLRCDHPDIVEFVECKAKEEAKARALIAAGYDSSFNGEAYRTIKFQNANLSVSVTDEFMAAACLPDGDLGRNFGLISRTTGDVIETIDAKELLNKIATAAWGSGDPGMFYVDTINRWHTSPADGSITTANPCQPGFATLLTPYGIRTFDDVGVGSIIWSGQRWTRIARKVATGIKTVNRYETTAGAFIGTAEHRVISGGKRIEVRDASRIDRCVGPDPVLGEIDRQDVVDGWVLGDGSIHKASNNLVHFYLGKNDGCFHDDYGDFLICHRPGLKDTAWEVQTTITADELPMTFKRVIPGRFRMGDPAKVRGFLRGLYAANGSVCGGRVTLKASSYNVILAVQEMLSGMGIRSYATCNKPSVVAFSNGSYECKESYDLNITIDRVRFAQQIGFVHPHKTEKLARVLNARPGIRAPKESYEIGSVVEMGEFPVYDITVEADEHTYWTGGMLVSNCGEFVYVDESSCNLASLNLMKFRRPDGSFDVARFRAACRIFITAQEILVDNASYPTEKIALNSHRLRPLGLGICGLGGLIMTSGLPYDSPAGRSLAGAVTAIMTGQAYLTSAEMAQNLGPFDGYPANRDPILKVVRMHEVAVLDACDANDRIPEARDLDDLWGKATAIWKDVVDFGTIHGFRNAQVTLTAPCGTIAFMMDSGHSTGLEPSIALVQYKTLAGGGMLKIVNPDVERALRTLGYDEEKVAEILAHIEQFDTIEDFQPSIDDDTFRSGLDSIHLPVFDCAFPPANGSRSIAWQGHIKILAAIQPFLSGSSSKTVNMPRDATIDDIRGAYVMAWKMGVKDVAIFRDGSKESQPVSTSKMEARGDQKGSPSQDELFFEANRTLGYIASSVGFDKDDILDPAFLDRLIGRVGEVMCHSADVPAGPHRERLPDTRKSITHKLCVRGNNGDVEAYMTVGEYPDGRPGELFVEIAKEGSTLGGLMDVWATGISLMLQYGVPLDVIVAKFSSGRFEPAGMTRNREIPFASSLVDYIVRWMAMQYLPGYREQHSPQYEPEFAVATSDEVTATNTAQEKILVVGPGGAIATGTYRVKADWFPKVDAVSTPGRSRGQLCPNCGSILQPTGSCWWCNQCMESIGGCG